MPTGRRILEMAESPVVALVQPPTTQAVVENRTTIVRT